VWGGIATNRKREQIMKFVITISQDEDGVFVAECPAIPGCISQGKTEQEAEKNIQEAIKECLEVRAEMGIPLTVAIRQVVVHV
jgi:predicted RNase H-like HicB family nuclease